LLIQITIESYRGIVPLKVFLIQKLFPSIPCAVFYASLFLHQDRDRRLGIETVFGVFQLIMLRKFHPKLWGTMHRGEKKRLQGKEKVACLMCGCVAII